MTVAPVRRSWFPAITGLVAFLVVVSASTASVSSADAAVSPSQEWVTAVSNSGSGELVGSSRILSFGASGITAVERNTAVTGNCRMNAPSGGFDGANAGVFMSPDAPTDFALLQQCPINSSRTSTITFSKPVLSPMVHLHNLDASRLTITGSGQSGQPIALDPVVKNNALGIAGNTVNAVLRSANNPGCMADDGRNPNGGCGSLRLDAGPTPITSFTFENSTLGSPLTSGGGDGWRYSLSFPTATLTKSFLPATIAAGATSRLTFSITNPLEEAQPTLTPLGFTDTLPSGVTVADGSFTDNGSCGAPTLTGPNGGALAAGGGSVTASGITVAAGAVCTISVEVTSTTPGTHVNDSSRLAATVANLVPSARASLTVLAPAISLTKTASAPSRSAVGEEVAYSFRVSNTGPVPLTDVRITEGDFSGTGPVPEVSCPPDQAAALAAGAEMTCAATYRMTQTDVDRGSLTNTATVTGAPAAGGLPVTSAPSQVRVPLAQSPALSLLKQADAESLQHSGQLIEYSFTVTNTGNVTVSDLAIAEQSFSGTGELSPIHCPSAPLLPEATVRCTAAYTVTQADVDAGGLSNTATATGSSPTGERTVSDAATHRLASTGPAALALTKSSAVEDANENGITDRGDRIRWSFTVTNTGVTSITGVVVDDPMAGAVTCPVDSLSPGASMSCTADGAHEITGADAEAGIVVNTATARGTAPDGTPVASGQARAAVTVTAAAESPGLAVTGGTIAFGVAGAAVVAVAAGTALVIVRRREDQAG